MNKLCVILPIFLGFFGEIGCSNTEKTHAEGKGSKPSIAFCQPGSEKNNPMNHKTTELLTSNIPPQNENIERYLEQGSFSVPGVVFLHGDEYQGQKKFLLTALSDMEKRLKVDRQQGSLKDDILKMIEQVNKRVAADNLLMGVSKEPGANCGILSVRLTNGNVENSLVFGPCFMEKYPKDSFFMQGVLVQEFKHLTDIETLGWDDDRVRISSQHELRGHKAEAHYFKFAKGNDVLSPTVIEVLTADKNSANWKAYLNEHQGVDYALMDKLQIYQYHKLPKIASEDAEQPYNDFINPETRDLLAEILPLYSKYLNGTLSFDERKKIHRSFLKVQAYLKGVIPLNNAIMAKITNPTQNAIDKQKEWKLLYDRLFEVNKNLTADTNFIKMNTPQ